jgi:two-component system, NarL family, invasion response regulator UvrY
MIKVLLADDHSIVRAGLRRLVEESGDMEVVAEAADGDEAIRKIRADRPDVAVIDLSMPRIDGLEVIRRIHPEFPHLPILVLTMHAENQYVVRAIEAGAMGYITKQSAPEQLVRAIRKVLGGSRYLTDDAAESLALRVSKGAWTAARWTSCPPANCRCCAAWPWGIPTGKLPRPTISASKPWTPTGFAC